MNLSNQSKSIIVIIVVLLTVSFYQSKKFEVSIIQIENPILRSLSSFYISKIENIKSLKA